ncbi:ABC transporter ATP-binding protein [Parachlamydia sp. AcF125]|uniref:ABC transporter ATP-binding protein n=1 Tax=Parachlamydia sp. AcF125 TaxID=2795736 RepID=UPI001BC99BDB|nr:ABC transporter ATP-binding protein [Parachlamydia sp. AcF125]MBS4168686.1 Choline transport ATP-binding protein OpuBA [Parachlamydia sp. AcF125]
MLNISNLTFSYEGKKILKNLSLKLRKGESGALIGTSGSGKSTLFKVLTGLLSPESGKVLIDGQPLSEKDDLIAYMMQEDLLLPWRTVLRNMTLSAELGKKTSGSIPLVREEARRLLQLFGLSGCEEKFPDELSGGMRQRVSLARALILNRPVLLLDEPFASLDVVLREQMYVFLRNVQQQFETTILMVTHDFHDALAMADRVFLLREGQISQEWTIHPEDRHNPERAGYLMHQLRQALHQVEQSQDLPTF